MNKAGGVVRTVATTTRSSKFGGNSKKPISVGLVTKLIQDVKKVQQRKAYIAEKYPKKEPEHLKEKRAQKQRESDPLWRFERKPSIFTDVRVGSKTKGLLQAPKKVKSKFTVKFPAQELLEKYKGEGYMFPTLDELSNANKFFREAKVMKQWYAESFKLIPGEAEKKLKQLRIELSEDPNADLEEISQINEEINEIQRAEADRPKQGYNIKHSIPEVIFIGRCNVGKSSLLNILTKQMASAKKQLAKASKVAGYTKALHAFCIGGRFMLIDSPGYGVKGLMEQSDLVDDYLMRRTELVKCYLLIHSRDPLTKDDLEILAALNQAGVPFDIVFTKIDKLKNIEDLTSKLETPEISKNISLQNFFFVTQEGEGVSHLRASILDTCGLTVGSAKPLLTVEQDEKRTQTSLLMSKSRTKLTNKEKRTLAQNKWRKEKVRFN